MKTKLLVISILGFIFILTYLDVEVVSSVGLATHVLRADYLVFLTGGTMFTQGHHAANELYNITLQTHVQQHILAGSGVSFVDGLLPFVHPPYVAIISTPLVNLNPIAGFIIWNVVQLLALAASLYLLHPLLPPHNRHLLWLSSFAFFPVHQSLLEGQIAPAFLLSIVLFWRCLRRGGSANWWAGVSLALGLTKPHLLILFSFYLLYKRNWRALGGFALSGAALYMFTAIFSGLNWPFVYLDTLSWLNAQTNHYGMLPQVMENWHGLLVRFGLNSTLLLGCLIGITVIVLVYAWWRSDRLTQYGMITHTSMKDDDSAVQFIEPNKARVGTLELQLAATTLASALTSLYLYTHDLTILLFSGAVILGWAAEYGWPGWMFALFLLNLFGSPLIFYSGPISGVFVLLMLLTFVAIISLLIGSAPKEVTR